MHSIPAATYTFGKRVTVNSQEAPLSNKKKANLPSSILASNGNALAWICWLLCVCCLEAAQHMLPGKAESDDCCSGSCPESRIRLADTKDSIANVASDTATLGSSAFLTFQNTNKAQSFVSTAVFSVYDV